MSLVSQALGDEESKAERELTRVETVIRELDLSYEAHAGFARALEVQETAAWEHFRRRPTLMQDDAAVELKRDIVDTLQRHKHVLVRDGSMPWSDFIDHLIECFSAHRPMSWNWCFDLIRIVVRWVHLQKARDAQEQMLARDRRLAFLLRYAEARALSRAARLTVSRLEVLRRRL